MKRSMRYVLLERKEASEESYVSAICTALH